MTRDGVRRSVRRAMAALHRQRLLVDAEAPGPRGAPPMPEPLEAPQMPRPPRMPLACVPRQCWLRALGSALDSAISTGSAGFSVNIKWIDAYLATS